MTEIQVSLAPRSQGDGLGPENPSAPCVQTKLLRSLVRLHGRPPEAFRIHRASPDGRVLVVGPTSVVSYPAESWTTAFLRHLHRGYFDPSASAVSGVEVGTG